MTEEERLEQERLEKERLEKEEADRRQKEEDDRKKASMTEEERIEAAVQERLKGMKENLDKAYSARDAEKTEREKLEKEKRERELKDLEEQGKHKEAYELRLAEQEKRTKELEQRNLELTRDNQLNNALAALPFRNDSARQMAYQEIVGTLIQNEQGVWVHKTSVSVVDFVKAYGADEERSYLFKPKNSSGADRGNNKSSSPDGQVKSVFDLSQDEVLKRAAEGKLPARKHY